MGLLNFFSSKDPEDYDKKGDGFFDSGAYGKAIVEYERALEKLEKSAPWDEGYRQSLLDKIGNCKEKLALAHEQTAKQLMEAGHNDDALQYIELALELTQDAQFKTELEQHLKKLDETVLAKIQESLPDLEVAEETAPPEEASDDTEEDEEYFAALIGTLPEEIQESYRSYPTTFKAGYLALNQGEFEKAAELLSQAMQEIEDPQSYIPMELATVRLNLGDYDEARRLAESFLEHHPDALPAYQLLCEIFWETKNFDGAETLLASIPEELADSVAGYLLRGETLFQAGKYAEAKAFYQGFLKNYEWHESIARALAKTHEAVGEMANARYIYREIMDQCRSCHSRVDPYIKQKFADLSFNSGLNTSEILELYLSLARELPENASDFYQKVSQIYSSQGNETEAQRFQLISEKYERIG